VNYLLDVNALVAWRHARAPHHETFHVWAARIGPARLRTCAHAELGFIRVSMQVFGYSLSQAQDALEAIKRESGGFVDAAPSPRLATWAATPARTSDAYLVQIAQVNDLKLATFDSGIADPAAELIA
jgi:predicted nucleic acid-binding protein